MNPSIEACAYLVERIRQGDQAAEEELVATYSRQVFAMAMARTRDREVSRDLVQDVMWAVLRSLRNDQLRDPTKLSAFVCGTARNVIASFLRDRATAPTVPLSEALELAAKRPADDESERVQLVERAMSALDDTDQQILRLTLVEGLKSGEIAIRLGLSSDVVRQRKTRAVRKVAALLRERSQT